MLLYFIHPSMKWRNGVLLVFSLIFYAWGEPTMILLMLVSVILNYLFGLGVGKFRGSPLSGVFLTLSLVFSLGSLGVFKYAGFFVETINSVIGSSIPVPNISLPIGISFYTFQILTYVIDVYKGTVPPQKSFFKLLLYICCFHQLVAGPIVRYDHIAAEIEDRRASYEDITAGISRFVIGFAKKVLLANMCGAAASEILDGKLESTTVIAAWYGIIMFTIQIYFDFSAYSDMAIGMGRMCGFHYRENFDYPYMSKSVTEFWRRWHISLGSFFRDYVYIPLGGNRKHQIFNLLVVWSLTGMWHGASWNFILWGLYFFVFLVLEKFVLKKYLEKVPFLAHIYLLFIVTIGWVLFYYTDLSKVIQLLSIMFGFAGHEFSNVFAVAQINNSIVIFQIALLCCMPVLKIIRQLGEDTRTRLASRHGENSTVLSVVSGTSYAVSLLILAVLFLTSSIMLVGESYNPFLYFRF